MSPTFAADDFANRRPIHWEETGQLGFAVVRCKAPDFENGSRGELGCPVTLASHSRAMHQHVSLVIFVASPAKVLRVHTPKMAVTARMRCLWLALWRFTMCQDAHLPVSLGHLTLPLDLTPPVPLPRKGPRQTIIASVIDVGQQPRHRYIARLQCSQVLAAMPLLVVAGAKAASRVSRQLLVAIREGAVLHSAPAPIPKSAFQRGVWLLVVVPALAALPLRMLVSLAR